MVLLTPNSGSAPDRKIAIISPNSSRNKGNPASPGHLTRLSLLICYFYLLFPVTFKNKSTLTANSAARASDTDHSRNFLGASQRRNYEYFVTFRKSTHICTSLQVKVLPQKCTSLLKKSKLFYLSKVTK